MCYRLVYVNIRPQKYYIYIIPVCSVCLFMKWSVARICALHLTHPSAHTHTHCEHTPGAVGSFGITAVPREQLGVCCLVQGSHLSCGIEGGREHWLFTPPTYNPCRTWDSNPRPSGYKSDCLSCLSIRPRLPLMNRSFNWTLCVFCLCRLNISIHERNL